MQLSTAFGPPVLNSIPFSTCRPLFTESSVMNLTQSQYPGIWTENTLLSIASHYIVFAQQAERTEGIF